VDRVMAVLTACVQRCHDVAGILTLKHLLNLSGGQRTCYRKKSEEAARLTAWDRKTGGSEWAKLSMKSRITGGF